MIMAMYFFLLIFLASEPGTHGQRQLTDFNQLKGRLTSTQVVNRINFGAVLITNNVEIYPRSIFKHVHLEYFVNEIQPPRFRDLELKINRSRVDLPWEQLDQLESQLIMLNVRTFKRLQNTLESLPPAPTNITLARTRTKRRGWQHKRCFE